MHRINKWITALAAAAVVAQANAQWRHDPAQLAMLPPYCKYTQLYRDAVPGGDNRAEQEQWSKMLGGHRNFNHLHHYCWGLEHTNRALFDDPKERNRRFVSANNDFDYVLDHALPNFVLLPEIHTKKGQNLVRMGKGPEGVAEFLRALKLKPDYWPPYLEISDFYRALGDVDSAKKWLLEGLAAAPNAKPLERRLEELKRPGDKASRK
jgi:tetratricopeptide (TPR) repeat protein